MNNKETIDNLISGDPRAFDAVYRLFFKGLCSFASQYVDKEEAEEIVQETMLWIWENRKNLMPDMSLKSLLFMIVKNKSLNRINHNHMKSAVLLKIKEKFEAQFDDPDFYLYQELTSLLCNAIERLPETYRIAFEMNRLENKTHKEIAQQLNVSIQTVNYRISQALKILRVELKDYLPFLLFVF
ncbi:MAG: RNA polymerase sigma-70 factor [Dysgonamonadaceae bacterium]|jgi:RNA polymerase sigma-70 factor (ECF subfamily)|nr:RNA polymerase sigma-70 factor [Dysgonamonadaceae bacterium]